MAPRASWGGAVLSHAALQANTTSMHDYAGGLRPGQRHGQPGMAARAPAAPRCCPRARQRARAAAATWNGACPHSISPSLLLQAYTLARIQNFALHFASRLNVPLTKEQVELLTQEVLASLSASQEPMQLMPQQNLRLVLRHDCL